MDLDWVTFLTLSKAAATYRKQRNRELFDLVLIATRGSEEGVDAMIEALKDV